MISFIIVNYYSEDYLIRALTSIINQFASSEAEVIIVDNSNTVDEHLIASNSFAMAMPIALIKPGCNRGFSYANNRGIEISSGDYIILMNPDTELIDGSLKRLIKYMNKNEHVGIAGPSMINRDNVLQEAGWPYPSLLEHVWYYSHVNRLFNKVHRKVTYSDEPTEVAWVSGACLTIRKSCMEDIGMLDESFFIYAEDTDLCLRAKMAGWAVVYYPEARIVHYGGGTTLGKEDIKRMENYRISRIIFFQKHYGLLKTCVLKTIIIIECLAKIVVTFFSAKAFGEDSIRKRKAFESILRYILIKG